MHGDASGVRGAAWLPSRHDTPGSDRIPEDESGD